jgi:hypothetical protein
MLFSRCPRSRVPIFPAPTSLRVTTEVFFKRCPFTNPLDERFQPQYAPGNEVNPILRYGSTKRLYILIRYVFEAFHREETSEVHDRRYNPQDTHTKHYPKTDFHSS